MSAGEHARAALTDAAGAGLGWDADGAGLGWDAAGAGDAGDAAGLLGSSHGLP